MAIRSVLAALVTVVFLAVPAIAVDDPWIEFDKKPQHNPTSPAPKTIVATGTINLPAGYKVIEVTLRYYKDGVESRTRTVVKATVDEKAKTWSAKAENVMEIGEYWVDAEVSAKGVDGQTYSFYSLDQRRVGVSDKKAP